MATKITKGEREIVIKVADKLGNALEGLSAIDLNDLATTIKTSLKIMLNSLDGLTYTNDPEDMMNLFFTLANLQDALSVYDDSTDIEFAVEDDREY